MPQEIKKAEPIQKDWFIYKEVVLGQAINIGLKAGSALILAAAAHQVYSPVVEGAFTFGAAIYLSKDAVSSTFKASTEWADRNKIKPKEGILGTQHVRFMYKGKGWEKTDGNMTTVYMPEFVANTPPVQPPGLIDKLRHPSLFWQKTPLAPRLEDVPDFIWLRTYESIIHNLKTQPDIAGSQAFLLALPWDMPPVVADRLKKFNIQTTNIMGLGKEVIMNPDQGAEGVFIRADRLDKVHLQEKILDDEFVLNNHKFMDAYKRLNDPRLNIMIANAQSALTEAQRKSVNQQVTRYLKRGVYESLAGIVGIPEAEFDRDETTWVPGVKRMTSWFTLIPPQHKGEELKIQTVKSGLVTTVPLSIFLKIKDLDQVLIGSSTTPESKEQLTYALYDSVQREPVAQHPDTPSIEQMNRELNQLGFRPEAEKLELKRLISARRSLGKLLKDKSVYIPVVWMALLFAVTPSLIQGGQYLAAHFPGAGRGSPPMGDSTLDRPGFPNSAPIHHLDWKISAYGGMNTDGYYITDTSDHPFGYDYWTINTKKDRTYPLEAPRDRDRNEPRISLNTSTYESTLKIPIKDQTALRAVVISNDQGENVPFTAFEYTDGTVAVEIYRKNPSEKENVTAVLVPSETNRIHAVDHINPLDLSKISDQALGQMIRADLYDTDMNNKQDLETRRAKIADFISDYYLYSLSPNNNHLDDARNLEQVVNAIAELDGMQCDLATVFFLFTDTTLNPTGTPMARAVGYNHSTDIASVSSPFLMRETLHAVSVDVDGEFFDPTPTRPALDPLTQAYMKLLDDDRLKYANGDTEGEEVISSVQVRTPSLINIPSIPEPVKELTSWILSSIGLVMALGTGGLVAKEVTNRLVKRYKGSEKEKATSNLLRKDLEELGLAYEFLNWVSWGREVVPVLGESDLDLDSKKLVQALANNLILEKVKSYVKDPEKFEEQAGVLDPKERKVFRKIADQVIKMNS